MTRDALSELMQAAAADEELMLAIRDAATADDVVRIAGDHGFALTADDLDFDSELSDSDLEGAAGGTILHPTMSVFCGTNGSFCTFNPYACQSPG